MFEQQEHNEVLKRGKKSLVYCSYSLSVFLIHVVIKYFMYFYILILKKAFTPIPCLLFHSYLLSKVHMEMRYPQTDAS